VTIRGPGQRALNPPFPEVQVSAIRIRARLMGAAFLCLFAGSAIAQSTPSPIFSRAGDEKSLTDPQLLGKRIFEDATLSEPQGMSCMSCHAPEHAFQGNNGSPVAAVALGSRPGQLGTRKTPTIMYKTYSPAFGFYKDVDDGRDTLEAKGGQFWDGRASDLVEQAAGPLLNPVEMNNPSIEAVVDKVKAGAYADMVTSLYGADVFADPKAAMTKLSAALFAYESSERFAPFSSKFDDYLRGAAKLTPEETRGYKLFVDSKKGNCIACHVGKPDSKDPTDWIFTDFTYDAVGAPRNSAIPANADSAFHDLGLCNRPGLAAMLPKDVKLDSLCGAFKVPTLRNVAVTGPYFHNGTFASLRDAVAFYATRDTDPARWYPKLPDGRVNKFDDLPESAKANVNTKEVPYDRKPGQPARLNDQEVDALAAFLKTLTDKGMK
jgi:cytochrome c peroxidase